jgi:hypothetical protein
VAAIKGQLDRPVSGYMTLRFTAAPDTAVKPDRRSPFGQLSLAALPPDRADDLARRNLKSKMQMIPDT